MNTNMTINWTKMDNINKIGLFLKSYDNSDIRRICNALEFCNENWGTVVTLQFSRGRSFTFEGRVSLTVDNDTVEKMIRAFRSDNVYENLLEITGDLELKFVA